MSKVLHESSFESGRLEQYVFNWRHIKSDESILQLARGLIIDFTDVVPGQFPVPYQTTFDRVTESLIELLNH